MKVYEFNNFKEFFEFHLRENSIDSKGRKKTTLAELAQVLGYNSPSTLSMIANGERLPTASLLESLFELWKIPPLERERIRLRVEIEKRQKRGKESHHLLSRFNKLTPFHKIDLNFFDLIRDWYILVVKILVGTPQFKNDPNWISQRLRRKITPAQAKRAIQVLVDTNYLSQDPATGELKQVIDRTETPHDIPSEAIRENHKSMMKRAIEAIDEQDISKRQFNSLSLQFDARLMPEAKQRILDFIRNFNEEFSSDQSQQLYQLNVQLFEHTNGVHENENTME